MNPVFLVFASLIALSFSGYSWAPRAGPRQTKSSSRGGRKERFCSTSVEVDQRVVSTLVAKPKESFAARFTSGAELPPINIAIGDTISVSIWESAAGGLFFEAPAVIPDRATVGRRTVGAGIPAENRRATGRVWRSPAGSASYPVGNPGEAARRSCTADATAGGLRHWARG